MSDRVRPLGSRVLVVRDPEESALDSGLILPDRSREKPQRGTVVRLGQGIQIKCPVCGGGNTTECDVCEGKRCLCPFQVEVGDVVFFNRYGGIEVEVDGEKFLIISEEEILAKGEVIDG